MSPAETEARRVAANLARNCGYAVFPCSNKKVPIRAKAEGGQGYKDATTDPDRIAWLWKHWPGPLIGVATGAVSGVDVLDIDSARHVPAAAWYEAAKPRGLASLTFKTRSGGYHVYFQHAAGLTCSSNKLAFGVDVKSNGGAAIFWFAAGTECVDPTPPAPWPAWLLDCVTWKPPPPPEPTWTEKPEHAEKAIDGILRAVASAREGERNGILFWGACRLRERAINGQIDLRHGASLLTAAARATGLSGREAEQTIASAWRAAR